MASNSICCWNVCFSIFIAIAANHHRDPNQQQIDALTLVLLNEKVIIDEQKKKCSIDFIIIHKCSCALHVSTVATMAKWKIQIYHIGLIIKIESRCVISMLIRCEFLTQLVHTDCNTFCTLFRLVVAVGMAVI